MANNETTTKFKVDISELKKAMQEAKRQISLANSEFKAVSSSMDNWSKSTSGLQAKLKQLDSNLSSQKTILKNLESQYEAVVKEQGEGSAAANKLKVAINNQKAVINNTGKEIKEYSEALDTAEKAEKIAAKTGEDAADVFDELGRAAEDAGDSAEESSGGYTTMKNVLANLVTDGIRLAIDALKDFATESVNTGMSFEAAMSEVSAISGATGKDFELLEKTAKEFGATTTFSASESAEALKYMALAGWDAETSTSALGGVLSLAAASGMDLASASDMVTDYLSAFNIEASQSSYFADLLAYAQGHANTSAEQLGEAYKNCAASLNAAGQDVETVTSLLSMMANQGFKGSEAGTALTAIMRDMTSKMKDGKIAIGKTNVEVMDANGNYRDLTDILKDVEAATNGMGDAERAAALSTTFTSDSTKGLNLLLNAGVGEAESFEEALRGASGTASDMADVMNDNLAGDVKQAQSALEDLQITAYDELQPALREIVQYATSDIIPMLKDEVIPVIKDEVIPAVKEFIGWIVDHKDEIIGALAGIAAGFVAFNVVTKIIAVVEAFKKFQSAMIVGKTVMQALNLTMAANPIALIIAAIAALVAAFIYLWNNCEEFRNFWITLWDEIKAVFNVVCEWIVNFFTVTIPEAITNAIEWFTNLGTKIGEFVTTVVKFMSQLPSKVWTWLVNTITKVVSWRNDMINKAKDAASSFVNKVIEFVSQLPTKVWTWLTDVATKVVSWGYDLKAKGAEAAKLLFDSVVDGLSGLPAKIKEIGGQLVEGLWNGINDKVAWITEKLSVFKDAVLNSLKKFFGIESPSKLMRDEIGKWLPEGIAVGINANADSALKSMKNLSTDLVGAARTGLSSGSVGLSGGSSVGSGVINNFTQNNYSPKSLSRLDIYRQSKNLLGYAGGV